MTVNKYSRPVQLRFIDTYAPIDFGALYQIGAANAAAVEAAQKELGALIKEWAQFVSPSVVDTNNWYRLTLERASGLLQRFAENPDLIKTAAGRSEIQHLFNTTDYASLSKLKQSAAMLQAGVEMRAKMEAENRYKKSWDKSDITNYDTLGTGKVFDDVAPTYYQSLFEVIDPYIKGLKPTFYTGKTNPNDSREVHPYATGWNAITANDIRRSLEIHKNEITSTPQGANWYQDVADAVYTRNPNATSKDVDDAFMEAMMRDASYKMVATPVEDPVAQQRAMLRYKAELEGDSKKNNQKQLSIEDVFHTSYQKYFKGIVDEVELTSQMSKINEEFDSLSKDYDDFFNNLMSNNKEYANNYNIVSTIASNKGLDVNDSSVKEILNQQALSMTKLTDDEQKQLNNLNKLYADIINNRNNTAMGLSIQAEFNKILRPELDEQNVDGNLYLYEQNPFALIRKYTDNGDLMYDESKAHDMWNKGLYKMSEKLDEQVGNHLIGNMFDNKQYDESVGGYTTSGKKLISPKQFVYNNNEYILNLAKLVKFDVLNTHLDRDTWTKDNFDIEELAAKGKFGNVAISDITGYIDTPNGRNYTVKVKIPYKAIDDYYNRWWAWFGADTPSNTLRKYGFEVTEGSGLDEDGIWKNGYVTVDMVLPQTNKDLNKIFSNRSYENKYGTSKNKEAQRSTDDAILTNTKGYSIGSSLTEEE